MRRLVLSLVVVLLAMVNSGWAGDAQWVEVKSPHFSVITDAGERRGRDVAVRFEQMRAVFGALLKSNVNTPVSLQIVAFRNTKEMRQFVPLWHGKPTEVSGLFLKSDDRNFILLDMSVIDPWQVVFHEYGHQLLNGSISSPLQPWFDEGFAEYFSTIKVNGKEADVGVPPQNDVDILFQGHWLKIADLFRVQQNSSTYNESGDHRSMFYAESWFVMHYLFDKNLLGQAFRYVELAVDHKVPAEQAIQQAFGMTAENWDKELQNYLHGRLVGYYKLPTPAGIETAGYMSSPLSPVDAKAELAEMHLHSPDYQDKAVAEFQEVLAAQPNNVVALRGLGYAYLRRQDFRTAAGYFEKAVAQDSKDPRVLYYSARLRNEQQLNTDLAQLAVTQKELESCVKLDPNYADAYSLLAFIYQTQDRSADAEKAMQHAVALSPRNENYAYNLAQMYLANRNVDAAVPILKKLKNSSNNPQIVSMASTSLVQLDSYKASLARGGEEGGQQVELKVRGQRAAEDTDTQVLSSTEVVPARFVKGKLLEVDCSAPPAAVLTVAAGGRTWKMRAQNSDHMIVIGADKLSCDWKNQSVAVNYRDAGEGQGDIISLELQ